MANATVKRIVRDGMDNAVVELIGTLDTSAAAYTEAAVITLADFTANLIGPTLVGLRLDEVQYSISDGLAVRLFWEATADEVIVALAGHDKMCFKDYSGLQPDQANAGYTGSIDMTVNNIVVAAGTPIQVFTLLLAFKKLYA